MSLESFAQMELVLEDLETGSAPPKLNRRYSRVFRYGGLVAHKQDSLVCPPVPDIRIPEDHIARTLLRVTEEILGVELRSRCFLWGGFSYDPVMMFTVLMYALMEGERSCRRIEERCRYDARFWFLTGSTVPDHSTLSRFRKNLDADDGLDVLFQRVVDHAKSSGLVKGQTMYVDGTKIPTSASQWRSVLKDSQEAQPEQANQKPVYKEPWDKEARTMKTTHGEYVDGFNTQIAVDSEHGIIVGVLPTANASDQASVGPLLEATKKLSGLTPEQLVGDKGYDGCQNHIAAAGLAVQTYFSPKERRAQPFKADENGELRCLAGHIPAQSQTSKRGIPYTTYRVSRCRDCPFIEACGKPPKGHQREISVQSAEHSSLTAANYARCKSDEGKALLRDRGKTVELQFARVKHEFGLRRFNLKGLKGARIEMMIACIALNIKTILRVALSLFASVSSLLNAVISICALILKAQTPRNTNAII